MTDSVLNPQTNRFVRIGTQKYKRLVREGIITPIDQAPTPEPTPEQISEPTPVTPPVEIVAPDFDNNDFKKLMAEQFTQVVRENESKLVDLSQKSCDQLLKKLLYQKLCVDKPEKKAKKSKKNKKKKFKIVEPSSSSSESESD